ncbi:MAG: hypothetical protein V4550_03060 [Gemmatimonadota bacterium]
MATAALRPRSVTEIVDVAFQILRAHYGQFVMCSAIAYLPWLLVELVFVGDPQRMAGTSLWAGMAALAGIWVTYALMSAVIITCASQAYLGDAVDVGAAVRLALPKLHRVMIAAIARYVLIMVGFLAMMVGSLYVVAALFALTPVIILEDASVPGAFRRTLALSKGRKRHVLNTLGLIAIIYYTLAIGVTLLSAMFGDFVVNALAGAFYTILAYPVIAITEALLYYDARIQSEGLDIELMADELGAGVPAAPIAP